MNLTSHLPSRDHAAALAPTAKLELATAVNALAAGVLRYGLVLVIAWIGLMKFTSYEAHGIQPLVANSPLMSWMYHFLSVQQFSALLGVSELAVAFLIAARPWSRTMCVLGSAGAVGMFLVTLSFLFSTPGWEPSLGGFPALSAGVGQFIIKDVLLLGAALWSLGEALGDGHDRYLLGLLRRDTRRAETAPLAPAAKS